MTPPYDDGAVVRMGHPMFGRYGSSPPYDDEAVVRMEHPGDSGFRGEVTIGSKGLGSL